MYRTRLRVLLATLVVLGASACGGSTETTDADGATDTPTTDTPTTDEAREAAGPTPRVALTHDGGVMVVDVSTGDLVVDEAIDGFVRISPAGDDRHVLISRAGGWQALDLGSWGSSHGDHDHHYVGEAGLTDVTFEAEEPGHVVAHHGRTTLFDDGTGTITVFDTAALGDGAPEVTTTSTPEVHHGVAVTMADGSMLTTEGDAESRSGVRLLDPAGEVLAETEECPGVHGEAFAMEVAVVGCEDGAVVVSGTDMTKVSSPDDYGRIGNQAGSEVSPVLLGDYKSDPDAELERPTRISLIDTRDASLRLVDLGASYSFRSLARGPGGEALVLGTDGAVHVIDPESGDRLDTIDVVDRWREPKDWQQPRPALHVAGSLAYVTDPREDQVHVLDLSRSAMKTIDLPHTPNEVVANVG